MKKLLILFSALFALSALGQSTTITSTIIDPLGNSWGYGTVTAVFRNSPGASNQPVWSGGTLNPIPPTVALSSSGTFTMTLPSTNYINPAGGMWTFSVCPDSSQNCAVFNTAVIGTTLDIEPLITAATAWPTALVNSTPIAKVYNVNQTYAPPLNQGGMLYDTQTQSMLVYTSTGWQPFATVGSGVPVLTNPPGSQTITQTANTFFNIITSGTGGVNITAGTGGANVNGSQILTKSSGLFQAIVSVDDYCNTPGIYDQSCLNNAVTAVGSNAAYLLGQHTYNYTAASSFSNLTNVEISGVGPGSIISGVGTTGAGVVCTGCINIKYHNFAVVSSTTPTIIGTSQLPTSNPATPVVIERMGSGAQTAIGSYSITSNVVCFVGTNSYTAGQVIFTNGFPQSGFLNFQNFVISATGLSSSQFCGTNPTFTNPNVVTTTEQGYAQFGSGVGYIPSINDGDIFPVGSGGACTTGCLSAAQAAEGFSLSVTCQNCSFVDVSGLTGQYYSIVTFTADHVSIHDNQVSGGQGQGACISTWMNPTQIFPNSFLRIENNTVAGCENSGIYVVGSQDFVVSGNVISYVGESGIKTGQAQYYYATNGIISNNKAHGVFYDGLDLSSSWYDSGTITERDIVVSGNHSDYNHGTGYISDGTGFTFTGNYGIGNGSTGADLAYCDSTVGSNVFINNVTRGAVDDSYPSELNIIPLTANSCGSVIVSNNHTDTQSRAGMFGIQIDANSAGFVDTMSNNVERAGTDSISGFVTQLSNTTHGNILGPLDASSVNFSAAGTIALVPQSVGGNFTVTLPGATGNVAVTNSYVLQTIHVASCTTAATVNAVCMSTITLPITEPDSAYFPSCQILNASGSIMTVNGGAMTTTTFTWYIENAPGNAAATSGTLYCTVVHP